MNGFVVIVTVLFGCGLNPGFPLIIQDLSGGFTTSEIVGVLRVFPRALPVIVRLRKFGEPICISKAVVMLACLSSIEFPVTETEYQQHRFAVVRNMWGSVPADDPQHNPWLLSLIVFPVIVSGPNVDPTSPVVTKIPSDVELKMVLSLMWTSTALNAKTPYSLWKSVFAMAKT